MKIVKDNDQSLLLMRYARAGKFHLAVTLLYYFEFGKPDELISEQDMWKEVMAELGKGVMLDAAMPKVRGEVLVHGRCFAPGGKPIPGCQAVLRLGSIQKTLNVIGTRNWVKRAGVVRQTEAEPFTEMPLDWAHAFGGPSFPANPLGKGCVPESGDWPDGRVLPLPNVEDPKHLVSAPKDRPAPAGFGPLDPAWPQRTRYQGTYDDHWLKTRWPYFPDDMDWAFFNVAPEDQRLGSYFSGNESFELHNLHPRQPVMGGRLPAIRPRAFFERQAADGLIFGEAMLQIDTLHLFPGLAKGVAIWRGSIPVADDEATDIPRVFVTTEKVGDAKGDLDHYREVLKHKLDRKVPVDLAAVDAARKKAEEAKALAARLKADADAVIKQVKDGKIPVIPASLAGSGVKKPLEQAIAERIAGIDALGQKLDALEQKFGPLAKIDRSSLLAAQAKLKEMPAMLAGIAAVQAGAADKQAIASAKALEASAKMPADQAASIKAMLAPKAKVPQKLTTIPTKEETAAKVAASQDNALGQAKAALVKAGKNPDEILKMPGGGGPPKFEAPTLSPEAMAALPPEQRAAAQEAQAALAASVAKAKEAFGAAQAKLAAVPKDPLADAMAAMKAKGVDVDKAQVLGREEVLALLAMGKPLSGRLMMAVDLSGLDLSGVDFGKANLMKANLKGAKLRGAKLAGALLNDADLSEADLAGADLRQALLVNTKMVSADLTGADAGKALFKAADLGGAKLDKADLASAVFEKAKAAKASFAEAGLQHAKFLECDVAGAGFARANLEKAFVQKMDLGDNDFTGVKGRGAVFWTVAGKGTRFKGGDFTNLRVGGGSMLEAPDFSGAQLERASFQESDLTGAKLADCDLDRAMVNKCRLAGADLSASSLRSAQLTRSDLAGAKIRGANLFKASLRKTDLSHADFTGSNLYAAETMQATFNETNVHEANLAMTKLKVKPE